MTTVGVVANPASGRDIRRLVAGASVFDNAEKGSMVFRAMAGLGTAGVERVLMMPALDGVSASLERQLASRRGALADVPFPALDVVGMDLSGTARDSVAATREMVARGVRALIVLGGDGTHRVVAREAGDVPLCALSTGTNNAYPEMREATVAGLATGFVATGRVPEAEGVVRDRALEVVRDGRTEEPEHALVDVAVTGERFVGARALWRAADVAELFVAFAGPCAVGLSSVAGLLDPGVGRGEPYGLHVTLADPREAARVLHVALAPGLVVPVGVARHERLHPGHPVAVAPGTGSVALDGEREIERRHGEAITVTLVDGPRRIDVDRVMAAASRRDALAVPAT